MIDSPQKNIIACRNDLVLTDSMENTSIDAKNKILKMSLNNFNDASVKAFGLAKISSEALNYNLSCYNSLGQEIRQKENYFGLIRRSIKDQFYYAAISDSTSLAEFNNTEDLINSDFVF